MKRNKLISKAISAVAACALLISAFGLSASAAEVDENDTLPTPRAVKKSAKSDAPLGSSNLPSYYSSVEQGYVSSVKSQNYNDCWVYGALGTFESFLLKNDLYTGDMSANHANLWGTQHADGEGWVREPYEFGRAKITPGYFTSWQGPVLNSKVPDLSIYEFSADTIPTDLADYGVTSIKYLYRDDPDTTKRAIMESGGISTYYSHTIANYNEETFAYYVPPDFTGSATGHAIEIVGWDDNFSADNFVDTPEGNGAWLVKNSWGENWGDNGYFWISYYDRDIFNSKKYKPSFQLLAVDNITEKNKLLQNEIYGATWEFDESYIKEPELTAFQSFEFDAHYNTIDKVIFESYSVTSDYTVYYVPDKNGTPDSNQSNWVELHKGTIDYAGYICVDISDFRIPDQSGSIAVKIGSTRYNETPQIGVCEWLTSSGQFTFMHQAQRDQSYVMADGRIVDLVDWYKENNNDDYGGTFVIKAVTKHLAAPGDINDDGKVDVTDATLLQKHIALLTELDSDALAVADMNSDGYITISDVTIIQRIIAGYQS